MSDWSDIGEKLKEAREERELTLAEVANETRIPIGTLRALERNDHSKFPSPVYSRSFLEKYAEFLGVEAEEDLVNFKTGNVREQAEESEPFDQVNVGSDSPGDSGYRKPATNPMEPLLALLGTIAIIGAIIWILSSIRS